MVVLAVSARAEDGVNIPEPVNNQPAAGDNQSNAGTQAFRLTLDVDFTTVGMKKVNDYMKTSGYDVSEFGGGFIGTLDIGIAVYPFLFLGSRISYLYGMPASYKWNADAMDPDPTLKTETIMDASLIPVELGATLRFGIPFTTIAISTGAFAGVCFARVTENIDATNSLNKPASYVKSFDGFGFSAEWTVAAELKLMKGVDFSVSGGYRMAGVVNVKQSENAYYTFNNGTTVIADGSKGDVMEDDTGTDVSFDYSGMRIGAGISLGF